MVSWVRSLLNHSWAGTLLFPCPHRPGDICRLSDTTRECGAGCGRTDVKSLGAPRLVDKVLGIADHQRLYVWSGTPTRGRRTLVRSTGAEYGRVPRDPQSAELKAVLQQKVMRATAKRSFKVIVTERRDALRGGTGTGSIPKSWHVPASVGLLKLDRCFYVRGYQLPVTTRKVVYPARSQWDGKRDCHSNQLMTIVEKTRIKITCLKSTFFSRVSPA